MRRNREELIKAILYSIVKIHESGNIQDIQDKATRDMSEYFNRVKIIQIVNMNLRISDLTDSDLYNLSLFLCDNNLMNDIELDDYFFETEINEAINNIVDTVNEYQERVIFKNVEYNENDLKPQYSFWLSYQEIAKLHDANILNYNFATQRKAAWIKYKNSYIRIPTVNETNVKEIKQEILNGLFEENTLTLNIRPTGEDLFEYVPETKTLIINSEAFIDIIDGFHRITAIHDAWKENPNIKGKMNIIMKNINIPKARRFIAQESKGTLNGQEEMMLYDPSSNLAKLIEGINTDPSNENILFNGITTGNGVQNTLVLYDIFSEVMKMSWYKKLNEMDIVELEEAKGFIVKFYGMTYNIIKKKIGVNDIKGLKDTIALDQTFISGFLFPSLEMYNNNNCQVDTTKIKKMVNKLDFTMNNNKYTYENQNDSYEIGKYIKAWKSAM